MELTYAIIKEEDKGKIDFNQIVQDPNTLRYSLDGMKFVIKYFETPSFISGSEVVPIQVLSHVECLALMNSEQWTENIEII